MRPWSNSRVQAFADYMFVERSRFSDTRADNAFAFALGCIFKRYVIVWKLRDRSLPLIQVAMQCIQRTLHPLQAPGEAIDWVERAAQMDVQAEVEMNFECFFLYGSILCDEISHLLLHLFGHVRDIKIGGHREFSKNAAIYFEKLDLQVDVEIVELARFLEEYLCDFRDKQIVHDFHPRKTDGLSFVHGTPDVCLSAAGYIYPKATDQFTSSKSWGELITALDRYVWLILGAIQTNHSKLAATRR
jgi:hypothetical protein